jgi:sugar lactone lactonase YvrE
MQVFSNTFCLLSEGPLWHPERCELFWFDISSKKLFSKGETERF